MSDFLFKEFDEVSSSAWKQKIQVDLKGADYNDTLLWKSNEGITVKPFYHSEDLSEKINIPINNWKVAQLIEVVLENESNKKAHEIISKGVEAIIFKINTEINLSELLKNIDKTADFS